MYHLATLIPVLRGRRLPLTRDQMMLLMAAINLLFLGLDTYLAHLISGTIVPREQIPVYFGAIAGVILLVAGLIALRNRPLAVWLATLVLLSSTAVGLLGAYFHLVRAVLPTAPVGQRVNMNLLIWAPPIVAPLTFALVGLWGLSAAWVEDPADSGVLRIGQRRRLRLPYSKTRAYLFMVSLGTLATLLSSVLDHARAEFKNPWVWIPLVAGILGTVITAGLGAIDHPTKADLSIYLGTMLLMIMVGLVGAVLHVQFDLTAQQTIVAERFLRGAPFLAPLLFANMGTLGLIALMDPVEK
ncbi:MAG: hypothetical protein H6667_00825 [Ardenticatenaceae bacterium]|nr:hypothetical protein [Ardenticatenaceae bacterium]